MSLLKNRNNDFEKKLQEQLDDTVYKPTESLWNRIDQEVNRPDFEKKVEGKVGNYQLKPFIATWEQIEAHLPPEPQNRRRVVIVWFSSLATLLVIAFGVGYQLNDSHNNISLTTTKSTNTVSNAVRKSVVTSPIKEKIVHATNQVAEAQTIAVKQQPQLKLPLRAQSLVKLPATKSTVTTSKVAKSTTELTPDFLVATSDQVNKYTSPIINAPIEKAVDSMPVGLVKLLTTDSVIVAKNSDTTQKQVARSLPILLDSNNVSNIVPDESSKLSLTILVGAHYGMMQLQAPNSSLSNTVALRKNVEQAKVDWSGGFLLDYSLSKNWMVSTGIQFTHFSMGMNFGTATTSTSPKFEPGGTFLTTDSITTGVLNNQRIKYSWNEIPVLFTYKFKPLARLAVEAKVGVSYAMINVVDVAMVAQNNIGVLSIKSTDAFPGFTNSWFAQSYLGLSYRLNNDITLTAMPYVKYSINNMIERSNWISQRPCMVGLSLGLRKQF